MKKATITLAGKQHTIEELPRKANAKWREELEAKFGSYTELFGSIGDTEVNSPDALQTAVSQIASSVNGAIDDMFSLVMSYSPKLPSKELEDAVYDSEVSEAFADVLTLAYPFGGLVSRIRGLIPSGR